MLTARRRRATSFRSRVAGARHPRATCHRVTTARLRVVGVRKQGVNDHCALDTDCEVGYTCVNDEDTSDAPWCSRFCEVDTDCLGAGSRCVVGPSKTARRSQFRLCTHSCDLLFEQTGCPSGMASDASAPSTRAAITPTANTWARRCDDDTCSDAAQVSRGLDVCDRQQRLDLRPSHCEVGDDSTCDDPDDTCVAFVTPLTIGNVEYGELPVEDP